MRRDSPILAALRAQVVAIEALPIGSKAREYAQLHGDFLDLTKQLRDAADIALLRLFEAHEADRYAYHRETDENFDDEWARKNARDHAYFEASFMVHYHRRHLGRPQVDAALKRARRIEEIEMGTARHMEWRAALEKFGGFFCFRCFVGEHDQCIEHSASLRGDCACANDDHRNPWMVAGKLAAAEDTDSS